MTTVEQALREALEWAVEYMEPPPDVLPPPAIVVADCGAFMVASQRKVLRRLTINDAYLDGLRGKP